MSYQNINRLPILTGPLTTYTIEQNVYGDEPQAAGWFVVEYNAIDNDHYIFPVVYATYQDAFAAMLDITA